MVSSQKGDSVRVFDFEAEKILESFDGVVASINKIADEDVACLIDLSACNQSKSTCSEELKHIIELAVNVSTNGDGTGDGLDIGLFQKDLFGHFAYNS